MPASDGWFLFGDRPKEWRSFTVFSHQSGRNTNEIFDLNCRQVNQRDTLVNGVDILIGSFRTPDFHAPAIMKAPVCHWDQATFHS